MSMVFGEFYDDCFTQMLLKIGPRADFLGPRDWSPTIDQAKRTLKDYKASVPSKLLLSENEIKGCGFLCLAETIRSGGAFPVRIDSSLHLAFVTPRGKIWMDKEIKKLLGKECDVK